MLFLLFAACREGMFGRNCQQPCGSDLNCKGLRFCLPDPYGCSCASGWFGTRCETRKCENFNILSSRFLSVWHIAHHRFLLLLSACPNDMYGPDCKLGCKCQNGGVCKRFSGCTCPTGWRGQSCEKSGGCHIKSSCPLFPTASIQSLNRGGMRRASWAPKLGQNVHFFFPDWAPQILELEGNLEWNLNSTPKIFCSATGNPLPSHNSIELRKLDSTVLKVENTDKIYKVHAKIH